jgi:hypothetical protein
MYLGPTLLRATDACQGKTNSVQSLQLGVSGEVGVQTGFAIGVAERLAATPVEPGQDNPCDEWHVIGGIPGPIRSDRWTFSPLVARRTITAPPEFVWRRIFGAQAAAGRELFSLSAGFVSRSQMRPEREGVYSFTFDSTKPMNGRFRYRPYWPGTEFPIQNEEDDSE